MTPTCNGDECHDGQNSCGCCCERLPSRHLDPPHVVPAEDSHVTRSPAQDKAADNGLRSVAGAGRPRPERRTTATSGGPGFSLGRRIWSLTAPRSNQLD